MWLIDFEEAIAAMKKFCGGWCCFASISVSAFGDLFIFEPDTKNTFYFVYFRKNGRIVKRYPDTWRFPEHEDVIYEGDE